MNGSFVNRDKEDKEGSKIWGPRVWWLHLEMPVKHSSGNFKILT